MVKDTTAFKPQRDAGDLRSEVRDQGSQASGREGRVNAKEVVCKAAFKPQKTAGSATPHHAES